LQHLKRAQGYVFKVANRRRYYIKDAHAANIVFILLAVYVPLHYLR
jgi:hypothetical protein